MTRISDAVFSHCGQLLLNAIEQTGDIHLGVTLALKFQPTYIGLPAYTAMNAERFEDGLEILERFFSLNFPAFEFKLMDQGTDLQPGDAAIRLRSKFPFNGIEYFAFSSAIVAINGLLKAMLRSDQAATAAHIPLSAPDGWAAIAPKVGFPFRFEAPETQIIFPKVLLDRPLPGADPINHARLLGLCEQFAAEMAFVTTPVTQVMAILEGAPSLTVSLSDIAAELGYSERGLRRQLERSGTSYRKLVDQVREQRARNLLSAACNPLRPLRSRLVSSRPRTSPAVSSAGRASLHRHSATKRWLRSTLAENECTLAADDPHLRSNQASLPL